jgi:CpXC motif protein
MSIFVTAHAVCPTCGAPATLDYPASINVGRRPGLRDAILDHSLFTLPCRSCGETLTFEPHITYLDMTRGQWILAESAEEIENWRSSETAASSVYDMAFGAAAPQAARTLGAKLVPRLVFGWPALIEKLHCEELGIDDVALESLKLATLKEGPERMLYPTLELRLIGQEKDSLLFAWIDPATGSEAARMAVPEAAYVVVKGGGEAWAPLTGLLAGRMYVDMNRVLRDAAPAPAI